MAFVFTCPATCPIRKRNNSNSMVTVKLGAVSWGNHRFLPHSICSFTDYLLGRLLHKVTSPQNRKRNYVYCIFPSSQRKQLEKCLPNFFQDVIQFDQVYVELETQDDNFSLHWIKSHRSSR